MVSRLPDAGGSVCLSVFIGSMSLTGSFLPGVTVFDGSEMTPMALAPAAAMSCTAIEPMPPAAPHTSTLWPGLKMCGRWPNSMR